MYSLRIISALSAAPFLLAAGSTYNTRFAGVTWDDDNWALTSTSIQNNNQFAQSFVSNGYIGSSFTSIGPFPQEYSSGGYPYFNEIVSFGTVAGFFDHQPDTTFAAFPWLRQYGLESAISGLPAWGTLIVDLNGQYFDASVDTSTVSNVRLTQNFKQGYATYSYTWTPAGYNGTTLNMVYTVVADKSRANRAYVNLDVTANRPVVATLVNIIDGLTALRTDSVDKGIDGNAIYSAVKPIAVSNTTAWVYSTLRAKGAPLGDLKNWTDVPYINHNPATIAQAANVTLEANKRIRITKFVSIASTDTFADARAKAKTELRTASSCGFDNAFQRHVKEWDSVFPKSSVTSLANPSTGKIPDHLVDKQISTVVAASVLMMNAVSDTAVKKAVDSQVPLDSYGFGVCGLLSDCYGGQRYWDQDVWMGPYLFAAHPFESKQITLSRTAFYQQSIKNIQTAYQGSKKDYKFSPDAAAYAWSAGRDGNCTAFAPCFDYEYHIGGDIVLGFIDYWASSGDDELFKSKLLPITNSIATFFSNLLQYNDSTSTWDLTNVTDPDEYTSFINNGAFTMSIIRNTLEAANYFNSLFGGTVNKHWDEQALGLNIPYDKDRDLTLEFTGMPDSVVVKQADVVMLTYPLNNPTNASLSNQISNLNYYGEKQDPGGPAMTYAIYSIDSSALLPSGCSGYTYDLYSWTPYINGPWHTFSEQMGGGDAYPFLTGFGGMLQVDLMGYLGLRYTASQELQIYPNLPPQIPYIRYPTFYFQGWPIEAEANATHTRLRRNGDALPTANKKFGDADIPIRIGRDRGDTVSKLTLSPGGTLVVENVHASTAQSKNAVQCQAVVSGSRGTRPGEMPEGAIDGVNGTIWQPPGSGANVTVDTSSRESKPIDSISIEWDGIAATSATVYIHSTPDYHNDPNAHKIDVLGGSVQRREQKILRRDSDASTVNVGGTVKISTYATLVLGGSGFKVAEWKVLVK